MVGGRPLGSLWHTCSPKFRPLPTNKRVGLSQRFLTDVRQMIRHAENTWIGGGFDRHNPADGSVGPAHMAQAVEGSDPEVSREALGHRPACGQRGQEGFLDHEWMSDCSHNRGIWQMANDEE